MELWNSSNLLMIQIMKPDIRVHVEVRGGFHHKANFAAGRKKSPSRTNPPLISHSTFNSL